MHRTRHILAAAFAGLALAAAGCGDDEEDQPAQTEDSVVQDEGTPADEQGQTLPPSGSDTGTRTTRTDGE